MEAKGIKPVPTGNADSTGKQQCSGSLLQYGAPQDPLPALELRTSHSSVTFALMGSTPHHACSHIQVRSAEVVKSYVPGLNS